MLRYFSLISSSSHKSPSVSTLNPLSRSYTPIQTQPTLHHPPHLFPLPQTRHLSTSFDDDDFGMSQVQITTIFQSQGDQVEFDDPLFEVEQNKKQN